MQVGTRNCLSKLQLDSVLRRNFELRGFCLGYLYQERKGREGQNNEEKMARKVFALV